MKYVDEYRDAGLVRRWAREIEKITTRQWTLMEVCGGQTHAIVRFGLDGLLPEGVNLVHGPGCPVCVTPVGLIDKALHIAARPEVIFCSFGDMLRVPGSEADLFSVKARGGDVRMVYSPLDALRIAGENPGRQVVFFAVGFETTAPANAMAVFLARKKKLNNFTLLVSQVLVPPAIRAIVSSGKTRIQGFLAAGHVCTVMGYEEYLPIASGYRVPIVVTGFEPVDILQGIFLCLKQLEEGRHEVENQYLRSVRREGNSHARELIREVFRVVPRPWRGIGEIPGSGLALTDTYRDFDAENRFDLSGISGKESPDCISGLILQGLKKPFECARFGNVCTPEHPLGATMVSSEGACAAYFHYREPAKGRI